MENFRKMSNTTEAFMFELLRFFMRPYRMKWDMNGRSSYLEGRRNVAFETVAHHHQFLRQHAQLTAKSAISFRFLVAHDAHHIKISLQSRSPEFILLILQFALGKDRQLIFRLSEFCQSLLHLFERFGIQSQQRLSQFHRSPYHACRHLSVAHLDGIFH